MTSGNPHSSKPSHQNGSSENSDKIPWTNAVQAIASVAAIFVSIIIAIFFTAEKPWILQQLPTFPPRVASSEVVNIKDFAVQLLRFVTSESDTSFVPPSPAQADLSTPEGVIREFAKRLNNFLQKDFNQRRASHREFLQSIAEVQAPLPSEWDNIDTEWWKNRVGVDIKRIQLLPNNQTAGLESRYGVCLEWTLVNNTQQEEPWIMVFHWSEQPGKILRLIPTGKSEWCVYG